MTMNSIRAQLFILKSEFHYKQNYWNYVMNYEKYTI
jgi:hypothetical protein